MSTSRIFTPVYTFDLDAQQIGGAVNCPVSTGTDVDKFSGSPRPLAGDSCGRPAAWELIKGGTSSVTCEIHRFGWEAIEPTSGWKIGKNISEYVIHETDLG